MRPIPRAHEAEAQVVVPVVRFVPVAIGTTNVPRFVVPAAAPVHPVRSATYRSRLPKSILLCPCFNSHARAEVAQMTYNTGKALGHPIFFKFAISPGMNTLGKPF